MATLRLGKVQFRIMRVLWEMGRANAREITDTLNKIEPIAHSTVQTLLRKLEIKKAVDHDIDDRTFIFYPTVSKEIATKSALHELIDRVFSGSPQSLVSHLLKNDTISREEIKEIRKLINKQEAE